MDENGDDKLRGEDIELQIKSSIDNDKTTTTSSDNERASKTDSAPNDKLPKPPKRDYAVENDSMTQANAPTYSSVHKAKRFGSFPRPEVIYKPEVTDSWMTCLKYTLIGFNLVIWLFGVAITGLGVWVKVDREFWDIQTGLDIKQFATAGYVLIAVGVIIMLIGFCGCYGAAFQKLWLLVLFSIVIIIVILMEIAVMAIVWTAVNNKDVKEDIKQRARNAMSEMRKDSSKQYLIDLIQAKLECCGIDGPDDYSKNRVETDTNPIPRSCTNRDTGGHYEQGCFDAIGKYFSSKAGILGGTAIAVFILQLAALVLTLCVACGIKQAATSSIF